MSQSLCHICQCRRLDFDDILDNTTIPGTGIEILGIGKHIKTKREAICNLCRFFHLLGPTYKHDFTQHVRLFNCIEQDCRYDPVQKRYARIVSDIPQQPFFCVLRKNARLSYNHNIEGEVKSAGIACYRSHESPAAFQLCSVNAASADWEAITSQLDHCDQQHPVCRQREVASSRLPYISLIDCATGEIVKGSLSDHFLALSYVWGPQNEPLEFESADDFSMRKAPLTICDAAKAVLELGRKYLWVDRYCINQRDTSEKKTMIDNMDLIYENSDVTLVALHNDHDQSRLPGVSTLSRVPQPIFDTGNGQLIYSFPAIMSLIENSKWNTRGWTYQEARLSRRCLFFSRYQVYLVCRHSTWSEAVPFDPVTNWITKLLNSQKLDGTLFGVDWYKDYWVRDRLEYSKRNLSRATDELDAFRGTLRRSSFITLWGVPIVPMTSDIDPNVGFALGLLWIPRPSWEGASRLITRRNLSRSRRPGFPTWSWASLHADICQDLFWEQSQYGRYLTGSTICFPENEANVQFWCFVDGHPRSLRDAIMRSDSPILPEYSRELLVEGDLIRLRCNSKGACQLFNAWTFSEPDVFDDGSFYQDTINGENVDIEVEALVLIQWVDAQHRRDTKRFVLMLLHWIDKDHAERIGLHTHYRDEFQCNLIHNIPRVRKRFILQ